MNKELYENTIRIQFEMINELSEKIDKAIEYIKDHYNLATKEGVAFFILRDNLLEILGDNNDN